MQLELIKNNIVNVNIMKFLDVEMAYLTPTMEKFVIQMIQIKQDEEMEAVTKTVNLSLLNHRTAEMESEIMENSVTLMTLLMTGEEKMDVVQTVNQLTTLTVEMDT